MALSLNPPGMTGVVPSSVGRPLMPVQLPGMLQVPVEQAQAFLQGFPGPKDVGDPVGKLVTQGLQQFKRDVDDGWVQRVAASVVASAIDALPVVGQVAGSLVSLSGTVAGIAAPFTTAIPYVGPGVAIALKVYAPLATVGGASFAGLATAAQGVQAQFAQANAAAAAAGA